MNVLVTGGCGFIGAHLVRMLRRRRADWTVVNLDKLTYAGSLEAVADLEGDRRHVFVRGDVADRERVSTLLRSERIEAVLHLAAETHVDRSITGPEVFVRTNVLGTQVLLEAALEAGVHRVVLVSTDEVYGSLGPSGAATEGAPLKPSSPYAASKASADLLALAFHRTFGLPVIITRSSNNYGPGQYPEKLIPLMIARALKDQPLPVYGDGGHVRDWLHVEDHCRALLLALERGRPGEIYNVGGGAERRNLEVVQSILRVLGKPESLIALVKDRPGHDRRYALDGTKARVELGWTPERAFEAGLEETVRWYANHPRWCQRAISSS